MTRISRSRLSYIFLTLVLAAFFVGIVRAKDVVVSGCGDGYNPAPRLMPLKPGPLTLANIYCLTLPSGLHPPQPSPDRNSVFKYHSSDGLYIARTRASSTVQQFAGKVTGSSWSIPFAWFRDSRSVFGVRQETTKPSGWALGPKRPFRFRIDGSAEELPKLTNPAGPLDELYWVGNGGFALAGFGTKGQYYRPEHPDPNPTIAFVDARAGRVLQSVAMADMPFLDVKAIILEVASGLDRRGNPFALIRFTPQKWVLWVHGQKPRLVPIKVETRIMPHSAISPDGKSALIMENLSATGMICERNPKCPAPTPQSGPIAGHYALPSGKLLWKLNGTAKTFASSDVPAVSPDGRFALASMPTGTIALLSMKNGAVLQEIPKLASGAMGFSNDGRTIWITYGSTLVYYRLKP